MSHLPIVQDPYGNQIELAVPATMIWYQDWLYRKSLTITGSSDAVLSSYQLRLHVFAGSGVDMDIDVFCNGNCNGDFSDIRFTDLDGGTTLDYWIETIEPGISAYIWVKVNNIPIYPNTKQIYIYYGKPTATSESNGDNTFSFFDDFDGLALDLDKWSEVGYANIYAVDNSYLRIFSKDGPGDFGTSRVGFRANQNGDVYDPPDVGFALEFKGFTWNQYGSTLAIIGPMLSEGSTNRLSIFFYDAWASSRAAKYSNIYTDSYFSGVNSLPSSGTANLRTTKDLSGKVTHYWNDVAIEGPLTDTSILTELFILTNKNDSYSMGIFQIDRIFLRNFTENEPVPTSWGVQESNSGGFSTGQAHGIYTFHTSTENYENKMKFTVWHPTEDPDIVSNNIIMELHATDEVGVVHILPLENEIYNVGADDKRWLLATGSQMFNDTTQTKTLNLYSGR